MFLGNWLIFMAADALATQGAIFVFTRRIAMGDT